MQPRTAAFWIYAVFALSGVWVTGLMVTTGLRVTPVATLLGVAAWAVYVLPMLWLFRHLGLLQPHPRAAYTMAFAWGGFGAVDLALPANQAALSLVSKLGGPEFADRWAPAIVGPSNEEPLKLIGVILLVLASRERFRSVASVMALGAMTGLGFQVVEDLSYTINASFVSPTTNPLTPVLQMLFVRGGLCGAWSHAAYTAVAAYGVGYFVVHAHESAARRWTVAVGAFALAWSMHALWNSPLLIELASSTAWALVFLVFKGLPITTAALLLWRQARRETRPANAA